MQSPEQKKEAVGALVKIAVLEAVILAVVIGVYLYTNNLTYLIGGIVGSQIVCVPMFLRWARSMKDGEKE
jgi:hypothetical protein